MGGKNVDRVCDMTLDERGRVFLTGYTKSFDAFGEDLFVVRFNSSGSLKQYTQINLGGERGERGLSVALDTLKLFYKL